MKHFALRAGIVHALIAPLFICSLSLIPDFLHSDDKIGFIEVFALADDREAVLKELIPGTREYYYFHALHYQNEQRWDQLAAIMEPWIERYGETSLVWEIRNREALLRYPDDNKKSLDYLKRRMGLSFNHQQERLNAKPNLPTELNQDLITWNAFRDRAFRHSEALGQFEDSGLDRLLRSDVKLDEKQRRALLKRLVYPDYERLVGLIASDLRTRESRGFGEFQIHNNLLVKQLDELLRLRPELKSHPHFIHTRIRKMHPGEDVNWRRDPAEREGYLTNVWNYVKTLDPAFISLKCHVLYQLLQHHRAEGNYPKELWDTYLKFPRRVNYMEPRYLNTLQAQRHQADLSANFSEVTQCPPIGSDETLVREYLLKTFAQAGSYEDYAVYIREDYLKKLFAESKLTHGVGDAEKWYSLLSPGEVQRLKDRVDIEFSPTNAEQYLPGDDVVLKVDIKNVKDLVLKVYEINSLNYFLDQKRDINTDLNLDGLIANEEKKYRYEESAIRRVARTFSIDSLKGKRGIWIVEFIGNGVSSRALVRKGQLQYLSDTTAAGTRVVVLNEANERVKNSSIWFGGREYRQDDRGRIFLPFSKSGQQNIILTDGSFASFDQITLPSENYRLDVGFHVDRETLLPGAKARLVVRPRLFINASETSVDLLSEVKLVVRSTDLDGIDSTQEVLDFELFDDKESVHEFQVPQRLQKLHFILEADVSQVSKGGAKRRLSDNEMIEINGIDRSRLVADLHLAKVDGSYFVEVLGKGGEALPEKGLNFGFDHEDFTGPIRASLKSDPNGRINLGPLSNIESLEVQGDGFQSRKWTLSEAFVVPPAAVHAMAGQPVQIVLRDSEANLERSHVAILEMRNQTFATDQFDRGRIEGGVLFLENLAPGDYEVYLRDSEQKVTVRVTKTDKAEAGYLLSKSRHLEIMDPTPLQISKIDSGGEALKITLTNHSLSTRVHVYANRFLPEFSLASSLHSKYRGSLAVIGRGGFESRYLSGRDIGEEYRYIIERRGSKRFPGNMTTRPGLLLNPWALRDTDTTVANARKGEAYKKSRPMSRSKRAADQPMEPASEGMARLANSPNIDFLPSVAPVLINLKPDENGVITVDREALGDRQQIHVVAIDRNSVVSRETTLPAPEDLNYRDLRLKTALDASQHFTQKRKTTMLEPGGALKIDDMRASKMEIYDTLGGVFSVLASMANESNPAAGQTLSEFSFILNWPNLEQGKKQELYSKYACHELSFFISRHDEDFFNGVIKPYLANKRDKTFLDHYLLGNDLADFLSPWKYSRLNMVERILLGRRLGGAQQEAMNRAVNDWFALRPTDVETLYRQYSSALLGRRMTGQLQGKSVQFRQAGVMLQKGLGDAFGFEGGAMPAPAAPKPTANLGMLQGRAGSSSSIRREIPADAMADLEVKEVMEEALAEREMDSRELKDRREKAKAEALYRKLQSTREWAENNYYQLPIAQQVGDLITVNEFWNDYANWNGEGGFYSRHFPAANHNFAEMMLALSVLDLPFTAKETELEADELSLTIKANSPLVVFHEEIQEQAPAGDKPDILISQNFFRASDRYEMVDGERVDKFVTNEFLTGTLYGCQVVITNPNSSSQKLDMLFQIPEGALPVSLADYTKTYPVRLNPFSTEKLEVYFYFPEASGEKGFAHYPVHVAKNEKPIAWSRAFRFRVVDELTDLDKASWDYLSQFGTGQEVLDYMDANNIHFLNLDRIAWRMRDNIDFFRRATELIRNRRAYSNTLWSYGIYHNELPVAREFLNHQESFLRQAGKQLECELVSIEPVGRHWYQHLEYTPLVNARAHRLGRDRKILNDRFHSQYHQYMKVLSYVPDLDSRDKLGVAYYLFLQDRIEEGLKWFGGINAEEVESRLQYDYLDAYAALYQEDPGRAAQIAEQYKDHGVDRWRTRFASLGDQVREIQGADVNLTNEEDREQKQDALAASLPFFDLKTEGSTVRLNYQNIEEVTVNYYEMDLEFLFSSQPFVSAGSGQFSYIKPNFSEKKTLPAGQDGHDFQIPGRFNGKNVLVEVVGEGRKRSSAVYANSLKVRMAENYGRVQVLEADENAPLSKAYVKVYAKFRDGQVRFFKDGYTDLRGKFDYVSLNTDELSQVDRLSILIMSDRHGALVKEAAPPRM